MSATAARIALTVLVLSATACSGARSYVVAHGSNYPVSMSNGLRHADGRLVADAEKQVVGQFSYDYKAWGMLWTIISFTGDRDISDQVNKQVASAGGDGITNLGVTANNCAWSVFTLVGVLPDCSNVEIKGNIVKVVDALRTRHVDATLPVN